MAQIFVFGRVMNDLVPKESQSKQSYVCFDLMERTKNWTQFYQVWAWDADARGTVSSFQNELKLGAVPLFLFSNKFRKKDGIKHE